MDKKLLFKFSMCTEDYIEVIDKIKNGFLIVDKEIEDLHSLCDSWKEKVILISELTISMVDCTDLNNKKIIRGKAEKTKMELNEILQVFGLPPTTMFDGYLDL